VSQPVHRDPELAERARLAGKRFLGGLLMAGGGLIALLCGLCSLGMLGVMVASPGSGANAVGAFLGGLLMVGVIGGVPTAVGVTLFIIGLRMHREGRAPPTAVARTFD
jgi:hypothetical protein